MRPRGYCDGVMRRGFLRAGAAGIFGTGVTLPMLLERQAHAAAAGQPADDISLLILFLNGGLSTIDTLDLKPDAPAEFRGEFSPIATNVAGIEICEHLPKLASQADKFSLVRSFTHNNSSHGHADHYMLTGYHPTPGFNPGLTPNNERPHHGSVIAHLLGPRGSIPPYVSLPRQHNSGGSAFLGATADPFVVNADPNSPNFSVPDLVPPLAVPAARLGSRQRLLATIDRFRESAELEANQRAGALRTFQAKAIELMTSEQTRAAFDIQQEPKKLRDEYGRTSLGQACLMARRLVEAGVRCVHVDHANWDTHYQNFKVLREDLLPQLDSALPTLLRDLSDRGLWRRTLVVVMGEFGRTPKVNQYAGRDHWGPSNTILLAGGGVQGGRVVGQSNSRAERPAADPCGPEDLAATIYHLLGVDYRREFHSPEGRPLAIVNGGRVLSGLL